MRRLHLRWPRTETAVSLRLFLRRGPTFLCLVWLAAGSPDAHGQALTLPDPNDLLAGDPAVFEQLLRVTRPLPVTAEAKARILSSLPREGYATLKASEREKLTALNAVLQAAQRLSVYEIRVIAVPQAVVGLHARAVVLISKPSLQLLKADELQALVAHEIGHEYLWLDYQFASRIGDTKRLRQVELMCDAIAIVTLYRRHLAPSVLMRGVEKVSRFNREHFGEADNESAFPSLAERRRFAQAVSAWVALRPLDRRPEGHTR